MTVNLEQLLGVAVQIVVLVGGLFAGGVWLKRWLRQQVAEPVQQANRQLHSNGGSSVADHAKAAADSGQQVVDRLDELSATATENRKLAVEALALARDTGARLDRHLSTGHGGSS